MSISSEISRIQGNITDSYTAVSGKGGTLPATQNSDNLATAISTIPTGTTPTGTKSITANGVYDVTDFASADVQVPTTAPAHYIEKPVDANGKLSMGSSFLNLSGITDIGNRALYYAYSENTSITGSVDMSSVTTISGSYACAYMCKGCIYITSIDLSSLTTVSGSYACNSMFQNSTRITSIDLSSLTTVSGNYACDNMFYGCTGVTSIDISSLTTISGNRGCSSMFRNITGISSVDLPSLKTTPTNSTCSYMFGGCTGLTRLSFYAYVPNSTYPSVFTDMLYGVTGCTVHFPIAAQSIMSSWLSVTSGFSGTSTVVLFDIVTTLVGADTNSYVRQQKDSAATATAWVYNDTLYYTSGTSEPSVNATIYSDAACTTAVTTIASLS